MQQDKKREKEKRKMKEKNKNKFMVVVIALIIFSACTVSQTAFLVPVKNNPPTIHVFKADFDQVWDSTLQVLEEYPIKTIEKDSGIIHTEKISGNSEDYTIQVSHSIEERKQLKKLPDTIPLLSVDAFITKSMDDTVPLTRFNLNVRVKRVKNGTLVRVISIEEFSFNRGVQGAGTQTKFIRSISRGNREYQILKKIGEILGEDIP